MNEVSETEGAIVTADEVDSEVRVRYGTEPFLSPEHLEAEKRLLSPRVWMEGRRAPTRLDK
ncbi:hypothetical protein [Novosphingobium album (ex Liu et al. 2023)]|uniref:Uncharacterized protein n=1 Tax=Novosphingobium album (ex Liu et al. 2023) TaxID=3031130 RepID=A0ABT5WSK0_9SPHN|nr:hypothetical protein [Novosphingobium album (ex Liu et al. 2023)]MDE8652212.1 hypothetical protein [Novosphingobium album (ex Liu et al. 2023)]